MRRSIALPCSGGLSASLSYYRPGTHLAEHEHDRTQVSFLLSGEMLERHRGRDWVPLGFGVGVKPAGLVHENFWGPSGVLIFAANLRESSESSFAASEPGWAPRKFDPAVVELIRACLDAQTPTRRDEAVVDLLALRLSSAGRRGSPPRTLEHARHALIEAPHAITIAEAAELAGLHRVRFSLLFREYYGLTPSLYRLRALTASAIREIAGGAEELSDIAYKVGFSDQSHMTRSVQRATGLTPGRLRSLLA